MFVWCSAPPALALAAEPLQRPCGFRRRRGPGNDLQGHVGRPSEICSASETPPHPARPISRKILYPDLAQPRVTAAASGIPLSGVRRRPPARSLDQAGNISRISSAISGRRSAYSWRIRCSPRRNRRDTPRRARRISRSRGNRMSEAWSFALAVPLGLFWAQAHASTRPLTRCSQPCSQHPFPLLLFHFKSIRH